ncbi:hypothetical protein [Flavilitoribacter nigricans]|uniref:Uncharacterized protein n=1 Tax=Flavilitoribacter nigricans (strain ATCC 23147 / DSM 23189 / NBRC 102662 / NCIMB 1420 / SS-2) TaxID=1122177 RepID=A0A2D0NA64_FLAN2|nr:hypothetical protein [Flavilitoribacter nigricans]PHN05266.1 hypothetical protein CRP01_17260 [Flavilitoribacter nigricans DSM 23189 = NBRC 102662]
MTASRHKLNTGLFFLLMLLLLNTSCRKKPDIIVLTEGSMTAEEVFALVEGAMSVKTEGMMRELLTAIAIHTEQLTAGNPNPHCNISDRNLKSDVFDRDRYQGTFSVNRQWILNCDDQEIPDQLIYSWEGDITYQAPKLSSRDYTDGNLALTYEELHDDWHLNGTYERTGRQISKILQKQTYETTLFLNFKNLVVEPQRMESRHGSATFEISGSTVGGRTFFFSGEIEFPDNGATEVTLGSRTYPFYPFRQ